METPKSVLNLVHRIRDWAFICIMMPIYIVNVLLTDGETIRHFFALIGKRNIKNMLAYQMAKFSVAPFYCGLN